MWSAMRTIYTDAGWGGYFKGMTARMAIAAPGTAISWVVYVAPPPFVNSDSVPIVFHSVLICSTIFSRHVRSHTAIWTQRRYCKLCSFAVPIRLSCAIATHSANSKATCFLRLSCVALALPQLHIHTCTLYSHALFFLFFLRVNKHTRPPGTSFSNTTLRPSWVRRLWTNAQQHGLLACAL
jgi:hypothetical protein